MLFPAHGQCMHLLSTIPTKQATPHNSNCCECLLLSREDTGHSLVEVGTIVYQHNYFIIMWLTSSIVGPISTPLPPVVQLGRGCHKEIVSGLMHYIV